MKKTKKLYKHHVITLLVTHCFQKLFHSSALLICTICRFAEIRHFNPLGCLQVWTFQSVRVVPYIEYICLPYKNRILRRYDKKKITYGHTNQCSLVALKTRGVFQGAQDGELWLKNLSLNERDKSKDNYVRMQKFEVGFLLGFLGSLVNHSWHSLSYGFRVEPILPIIFASLLLSDASLISSSPHIPLMFLSRGFMTAVKPCTKALTYGLLPHPPPSRPPSQISFRYFAEV